MFVAIKLFFIILATVISWQATKVSALDHFLRDLMGKLKYYFNPKTFQYDRVRLKVWNVIWYALGLMVVSGIFFFGIFFLDNLLFETEYEAQLRFENKSLKKHKTLLASQLASMENTLSELQNEDKKLYAKIFSIASEEPEKHQQLTDELSYSSLSNFRKSIKNVRLVSAALYKQSRSNNYRYSSNALNTEEVNKLSNIPSLSPVDAIYTQHLVSGFGKRINPFHKGKYEHPGIDFSIPRGSSIYATANGKIVEIKKSDLQAGYGNYVEIDHGNGYITRYAHLENIHVRIGQKINKGEPLGTSGMSGGSISPHLHYEVLLHDENIDPIQFLIQGITPEQYAALAINAKTQNQSLD